MTQIHVVYMQAMRADIGSYRTLKLQSGRRSWYTSSGGQPQTSVDAHNEQDKVGGSRQEIFQRQPLKCVQFSAYCHPMAKLSAKHAWITELISFI